MKLDVIVGEISTLPVSHRQVLFQCDDFCLQAFNFLLRPVCFLGRKCLSCGKRCVVEASFIELCKGFRVSLSRLGELLLKTGLVLSILSIQVLYNAVVVLRLLRELLSKIVHLLLCAIADLL